MSAQATALKDCPEGYLRRGILMIKPIRRYILPRESECWFGIAKPPRWVPGSSSSPRIHGSTGLTLSRDVPVLDRVHDSRVYSCVGQPKLIKAAIQMGDEKWRRYCSAESVFSKPLEPRDTWARRVPLLPPLPLHQQKTWKLGQCVLLGSRGSR